MSSNIMSSVPSWRTLIRWSITIFAIWVITWMVWNTGAALVPFILGLISAYLLLPLVNMLTRWMPRWLSVLLIYITGIGLLGAIIVFIVPPVTSQVGSFISELPAFWENTVLPFADERLQWYRQEVPADVQEQVDTQLSNALVTLRENATVYAQNVVETVLGAVTGIFRTLIFLAGFLIVPFWLFYVLLDEQKGKIAFDNLLPERIRPDVLSVLSIFDRTFSAYIRGQITLGLIIGIMSYAGLWFVDLAFGINVPYKLLLAVIAGFTELIPVIGPILGAVPAIIVGLTQSPTAGLIIAVLYIVIQQIENNVLVPRIIGSVVEIHAAVLMILLVVSAQLAGLVGVILSAPLTAVARDTYRYVTNRLRDKDDPRYLPAGALQISPDAVADFDDVDLHAKPIEQRTS